MFDADTASQITDRKGMCRYIVARLRDSKSNKLTIVPTLDFAIDLPVLDRFPQFDSLHNGHSD